MPKVIGKPFLYNFAVMRLFFVFATMAILFCSSSSFSQGQKTEITKADTLPIKQIDGTTITLVAFGDFRTAYLETTDGYTVVLNPIGLYEYAAQTKDGGLAPCGILAHNPINRKKKEIRKVKRIPKHLRFTEEKIKRIKDRQEDFFNRDKNKLKNEK
ncbi:MAG: hypothetical protein NTX03_11500 [Bacteroidetes bacterium]|nr:hypothetical protein [Bacteroidota bacterium]